MCNNQPYCYVPVPSASTAARPALLLLVGRHASASSVDGGSAGATHDEPPLSKLSWRFKGEDAAKLVVVVALMMCSTQSGGRSREIV